MFFDHFEKAVLTKIQAASCRDAEWGTTRIMLQENGKNTAEIAICGGAVCLESALLASAVAVRAGMKNVVVARSFTGRGNPHAWVEVGNFVYDVTSLKSPRGISRDIYYSMMGIKSENVSREAVAKPVVN